MDVVEIGGEQLSTGSVHAVKPLATLAMIDDGELDWKIIAIRADDPRAAGLNDVEDVERCADLVVDLRPYVLMGLGFRLFNLVHLLTAESIARTSAAAKRLFKS